ncbi:unnamed protein product [Staurois parvus]|uniref:Succinate dehydrogenase subunit 4 n=1 Tax=Staurois parvus TaxID=386267 RepID=A0ABN9EPK4_9NEOB|nr:unnamed protein product [Staurois parvus]
MIILIHTLYCQKVLGHPLQIIGLRCSNHLHGYRLLLQTFVKEWVALRSSVNSCVVL